MYKNSEETVNPLLLHCLEAMELWNFMFLFGVKWMMPKTETSPPMLAPKFQDFQK